MTKSWQVCLWSKQGGSSRHANGPSNRHSLQLCYPVQHQPYLLVHARQCCHILGEQASCPAESLPQTHIHIHKTCYKFFREVKDSHKQQTSCFTIFLASSYQSVQLPAMDFATGKKSSWIQGTESDGKHNHLSSFQYCSTGFILTSKKKPSTKAWVLGRILCTQKNWPLSMFSVTMCFIL